MKNRFRLTLCLVFVLASLNVSAEELSTVKASVREIIAELKDAKGVNSVELQKGQGLGVIKAFLRPKLGKEFLEGVTSMIVVEHSKASEEVCATIQKRLDSYSATLREFRFDNNEFGGNEKVRGYVALDETMVGSDLVMIVEDKGAKLFIYMGGVLKVEKLDLSSKSR